MLAGGHGAGDVGDVREEVRVGRVGGLANAFPPHLSGIGGEARDQEVRICLDGPLAEGVVVMSGSTP